ncbi:MAG TPA: hypothetical protein VKF62_00970, partial [Planctomycetota bacterium]|nr:hypothetical protein [Planctomycetota bacterium]
TLAALALLQAQSAPAPVAVREVHRQFLALGEATKDRIWPGFDAPRYVREAADAEAGDVLRFSSDLSVADPNVFMTVGADYLGSHSAEENLGLLFHEAFHAFEGDAHRPGAKWGAENASLLFEYSDSTPRNDALFSIECRLLLAALEAGEADGKRAEARRFLAVRGLRQAELEPRFVQFEKGLESNEGLAEYAGFHAVALAADLVSEGKLSLPIVRRTGEAFLAATLRPLGEIGETGKNARRRFYFTGAAQGFLLDRLAPDWKKEVQEKAIATQDLLAKALGPGEFEEASAAALEEAGYAKALRVAMEGTATRKEAARALRDSVLGKGGLRIVVEAPGGGFLRSFDPMNVVLVEGGVRVHTRMLQIGGPSNLTASFERPLVQETREGRYTTVLDPTEGATVSVGGSPIDLSKPGEHRGGKVTVEGPGVRVEADAGLVRVEKDRVLVRAGTL